MKARVIATGKIVDVVANGNYYDTTDNKERYYGHELDFNDTADYWTRLEHQYAGMAMQGMLSDNVAMEQIVYNQEGMIAKMVANFAVTCAAALVKKLKEKEERI